MSKFATPEDLLKSQVAEFNKGNFDFLMTLYGNDACFVNQPDQVVKDKELIRNAFRDFINKRVKLEARTKRIYYVDNLALLITEWSLNGENQMVHLSTILAMAQLFFVVRLMTHG